MAIFGHVDLWLGVLAGCLLLGLGFLGGLWFWSARRPRSGPTQGRGDEAFFKGFQYLLSNSHDLAIEAFTKSVQLNSETIETYVALGNLYRSKGDIERAIRIRQSIILRPNLDPELRLRALFDLGLDYRKGGFLNRALKTFLEVAETDGRNVEAVKAIEKIYEELGDWENALKFRQKMTKLIEGPHSRIMAHQYVEIGKAHAARQDFAKARAAYEKALNADRGCVAAYLRLGDLHFERGEDKKAVTAWKKAEEMAPEFAFLVYGRLDRAYTRLSDLQSFEDFLRACVAQRADARTHLALARHLFRRARSEEALKELTAALRLAPGFWEAWCLRGEVLRHKGDPGLLLADYEALLAQLQTMPLRYRCAHCGLISREFHWQCLSCREWDTLGLMEPPAPVTPARAVPPQEGAHE